MLLLVGVFGAIFVLTFDIITGKPVNDITGPKSISALVICGLFIIGGIRLLLRKPKEKMRCRCSI